MAVIESKTIEVRGHGVHVSVTWTKGRTWRVLSELARVYIRVADMLEKEAREEQ